MSLPQFAPFPAAKVRQTILPDEWGVFLDSWASLADLYLRCNHQQFWTVVAEGPHFSSFLISFFHELANDDSLLPGAFTLRKRCFLLVHRVYSGDEVPVSLLSWSLASDLSRVFSRSDHFRTLLQSLWKRKALELERSLQLAKNSLIKNLDSKRPDEAESTLDRLVPLLKMSSTASTYMLTGSDLLDSLCAAYPKLSAPIQAKAVTLGYLGLTALLEGLKPSYSVLSDHLYSLKSFAQGQKTDAIQNNYVSDLVTNTPLLYKIRDKADGPEAARVKNFAASLGAFQQSSITRTKKIVRRKVDKGKRKAAGHEYGHEAFGDIHVHRMSLVSQVQDLFPDLGSGFVAKLLHEYNDNVEDVTAHLLEDSLPSKLANADRSEPLHTTAASNPHFTPRSTPPPPSDRRNVFDNDDFDRLAVDTSRLHIGRKDKQLTADSILYDRHNAPTKSAILSALAAFDSDDDERDDTYDVEDVGGTVDSAAPGADEMGADLRDKNEEALFRAFSSTPELFARDAETRRGKARAALKSETGMTDEAIEGWGLMMGRDPKRLERMEAKFSAFSGQQAELVSTAWRSSPAGSDGEPGAGSGDGKRGGRGGRGHNRGRGRGGGRAGGNVAGPSDDKTTQSLRQKKETNKGSRANHNRRDQRARKMARGGLAG